MVKLFKTYFKPFWPLFIGAFALTVGRVLCELELPNLMSDIINQGVILGDVDFIFATGGVMVLWAIAASVVDIGGNLCAARASMGYGRELRSALYRSVSAFSPADLDQFGTSSLITRTTNDVQQLERFVQMLMTMGMMSPIMLVGAATMVVVKCLQLSVVLFVAIPVLVVLIVVVVRFSMPLLRSLQQRIDRLNLVTREGLTGVRVIRAYRKEGFEEQRFSAANRDLAETNVAMARRMMALMPASSLVLNGATIAIVWIGAQFIDMGSMQVGDLMAVIQYTTQVLFSAMMTSAIFMILPRSMAAAERIGEVVDAEPSILDADVPAAFDATSAVPRRVRFEHVGFTFPGAEQPALADIDFEVEPGKTYALIGSTGAGKTTLVNLLLRFYNPTQGRILVDGVDIASIAQEDLRTAVSYVPQKTVLFTGSIADNIRYGNQDASMQEVERAARGADAYDFVTRKEGGFDTQVTQAGGGLSGGQRQRIAIARALAKRTGLYVFDDSFSALDFKTDAKVRHALAAGTSGATVLIVAQRVAAAMDADQVVVIDEGRVVGVGTHDELVADCAVYREIVASQLAEGEVG